MSHRRGWAKSKRPASSREEPAERGAFVSLRRLSLRLIGSVLTIEHLVISGRAAAVVVIALAMTASIALVALALVPRTGGTAVFVENAGG